MKNRINLTAKVILSLVCLPLYLGSVLAIAQETEIEPDVEPEPVEQWQPFSIATMYNAFMLEGFEAFSSDIQGRLAAGGEIRLSSYSIASELEATPEDLTLVSGADIYFENGRLFTGSMAAAGSVDGVTPPVIYGLQDGAQALGEQELPFSFQEEFDLLESYSTQLSELEATGTVEYKWGGAYLTGDCDSDFQVFNLDGHEVYNSHTFAVECVPVEATIVFNLSGLEPGFTNVSLYHLNSNAHNIVYNFFEAEVVHFSNIAVEGSVLAPKAHFATSWGHVNGTVMGRSWSGPMELHHVPFTGDLDFLQPPPRLVSEPVLSVSEGELYEYPVLVENTYGPFTLTFIGEPPAGLSIDEETNTLLWQTDYESAGQHEVTLSIAGWEEVTQAFTIDVLNVNRAPVVEVIQAVASNEADLVSIQVSATDPDQDPLSYSLSDAAPEGMSIDGNGLITWQTSYSDAGTYELHIYVSDGAATVERTFNLSISNTNRAPVITSQPIINAQATIGYEYVIEATDPDGDAVTLTLGEKPGALSLSASGVITWTPTLSDVGPAVVTVFASDGNLVTEQAFELTVATINLPPEFTSVPVEVAVEDALYTYTLQAQDPNVEDSLSFELVSGPPEMSLVGNQLQWTPTFDDAGVYAVSVEVSDGELTDEHSFSLTVEDNNRRPEFISTPITDAQVTNPYQYTVQAVDPDSDEVSLSLSVFPAGMTMNEVGVIEWTPGLADVGEVEVKVGATDGNLTAAQTFVVNVAPLDLQVTSEPSLIGFTDVVYEYSVEVSRSSNIPLSFSLINYPPEMTIDESSGLISWLPTEPGTFGVTIEVSDNVGYPISQSYNIQVVDAEPNHEGDDFWLLYGWNHNYSEDDLHVIYVSSRYNTNGTISIDGLQYSETFTVSPGEVTSIVLPQAVEVDRGKHNKGIHIKTDRKATVYALNRQPHSSDGFLVHPTVSLGKEYMALEYPANGLLYAVATEDNTEIEFTAARSMRVNGVDMQSGEKYHVVLDSGEIFGFHQPHNSLGDMLTGSTMSSSKPIAAFSGNVCNYIPIQYGACDHLFEQLVATERWGTEYISVSLAERANGDTFRVLAAADNTEVRINGNLTTTLNKGEVLEDIIEGPTYFKTSKPSLVAQFSNGASYDEAVTGSGDFDPFMAYLTPTSGFLSRYTFATPGEQMKNNYINIVAREVGIETLQIDGIPISGELFSKVPGVDYWGAQIPVSIGTHTVTSDFPFGMLIYGYDDHDSYGYQGGMLLANLSGSDLSVVGGNQSFDIGEEACFTANLNRNNLSVFPVRFDFTVSGVNSSDQSLFNAREEGARYCYSSAEVGVDEISVSASSETEVVTIEWVKPADTATPVAPKIVSTPLRDAFLGSMYNYQVQVFDANGLNNLIYALVETPDDQLAITQSGLISWNPAEEFKGENTVTVRVSDETGLYDEQTFVLTVSGRNRPPEVESSLDPFIAYTNKNFNNYSLNVIDPDGDALYFEVIDGPERSFIGSYWSNQLTFSPQQVLPGDYEIIVKAQDSKGASLILSIPVILKTNVGPEVLGISVLQTKVGHTFGAYIEAQDENGDDLKFYRQYSPRGSSIDIDSGYVEFTPASDQVGKHAFSVIVSDGLINVPYIFEVEVFPEDEAFSSSIAAEPTAVNMGESVTLHMSTKGGLGQVLHTLSVDGADIPVDNFGRAIFSDTSRVGIYRLESTSVDSFGNVSVASGQFSVADPDDVTPPIVSIDNIQYGDILTSPTDIISSVQESNLERWILYYKEVGSALDAFTVLAEGHTEFDSAPIANFDTTLLKNGQYIIALDAHTLNGLSAQDVVVVTVEGDMKVGNFNVSFSDIEIPMLGIPVNVTRTYDSRSKNEALDFGHGWSIGYQDVKVHESIEPTVGWQQYASDSTFYLEASPITLPSTCTVPIGEKRVTVTLPNGDVERFSTRARPVGYGEVSVSNPDCTLLGGRQLLLSFQAEEGTYSTLEMTEGGPYYLTDLNHGNLSQAIDSTEAVDITQYTLTTREGYVYELDQSFGVRSVIDPNGHVLTYTDAGIFHSEGKSITFERDEDGRITHVTDPRSNTIEYRYDNAGDLQYVIKGQSTTTFVYNDEHLLLEILDPLNRKLIKNHYDEEGRLYAQEDGDGNFKYFTHDLDAKSSLLTDRDGRTTVYVYDDEGNVTSETQVIADGSYEGDIVTSYGYDEYGHEETRSVGDALHTWTTKHNEQGDVLYTLDPESHRVDYLDYNDLGQETKIKDELGRVTELAYSNAGSLLGITMPSVTDPDTGLVSIHKATNSVNARGQIESTTDLRGVTTSYTYYPAGHANAGQKWTESHPETGVITYTYDANNNVKTESQQRTVAGNLNVETVTYEYDALNRLTKTLYPDESYTETVYDLAGNVDKERDRFGVWTDYTYDAYGRLTDTLYANGTTESRTYTREGLLESVTDQNNHTTHYSYDDSGRQWKVTFHDTTYTETKYTPQGWVKYSWDEKRNLTEYEYDQAGRRKAVIRHYTDSNGVSADLRHSFEYYDNGEIKSETDALGRTTEYTINALDQRIETNYHNATSVGTRFDPMGAKLKSIDQRSVVTDYRYDDTGRLEHVQPDVYFDGERVPNTSYSYDEAGNMLSQTDANGHTTHWTYDYYGRVLNRVLPEGMSETFVYDDVAHSMTNTDLNGDVSVTQYDDLGRVQTIRYGNGTSEAFEYWPNGSLMTVTDKHGSTHYTYDDRDRLETEVQPSGDTLTYDYDQAGNRTQVIIERDGETITQTDYTYDELNRLETVTDAQGTTRYAYDAVGNLDTVTYPNGIVEDYDYNSVNQLSLLTIRNAANDTLASYDYGLDDTGRRRSITEADGRSTSYDYDDLYRLTEESITDLANGNYLASYQYDWVGNRIYDTVQGVQTAYNYDDNDRLQSQGGVSYEYDLNGNLLTETLGGIITGYQYDERQNMVALEGPEGLIEYRYNHNRIRIGKVESGVETQFIVDANRDYAQVLAEVTDETLDVTYTYGHDLVSQTRNQQERYFLYDGLGSTRVLTDTAGLVTDTYDYEAFGNLLNSSGVSDNNYLFTGEQYDAGLGQYYLRARYYNQGIGRFTQMDTWMGNNYDPITLHKYLYANTDPVNVIDPSGHFGIHSVISGISVLGSLTTAATIGYESGSILNRAARTGEVLSAENTKSTVNIALSILPLKYLTKVADLSTIAAKLHRLGFDSIIYDTSKSVTGFNKVYHWVHQLHDRGFTVEQAIEALTRGATWIDTKSGAVVKVIGDPRANGTIKVLLKDGKITTVLRDKLTKKFVPYSSADR